MGGTSHYVVTKKDHPGSSLEEIQAEPNWGGGHNHHVGYKNKENRMPGYVGEALGKYRALQERESRGDLVNFRDIINGEEDLHLLHPEHRSLGWRYVLNCTEDWVKYGQNWPANQKAKQRDEGKEKPKPDADGGQSKKNDSDGRKNHGDLKTPALSLEEQALLRALDAESKAVAQFKNNPGNRTSPQKRNRSSINIDEADQFTPDNWIPRSKDLIRLTGQHPLNAEAPLTELYDTGLITSNELHYVRNHGPVPRLFWEFHRLFVDTGSPNGPREFSMEELTSEFRSINIPVLMACDGNRRKELNLIRRSKGFNWGPGACGCVYWKGAPVRDVLLRAGLQEEDIDLEDGTRRWLNFEGADELAEGKYATSIPLAYALDESNDVMLAYEMNDLPLPPDHGYPVRLVIPGHVGGRCVKWLKRIWISDKENDSYYHLWDNRVLPAFVADMESPFAETLFRHPSTACMEQNLNSVIVRPQHGERLPLEHTSLGTVTDSASPNCYRIQGYAYDGGGHEVQRVEVSLDGGENWLYCVRRYPEMPVRHGKKFWTWCHWHIDVPLGKLVRAHSITVRCFNVFKNTQPRDANWNIMGMMNNCWYSVRSEIIFPSTQQGDSDSGVDVDSDADEGPYVLFRHPVEPGTGQGGWMKPSVVNQLELAKREAGTPQKQFTREEIEKHDKPDDCWIVVDGKVYDATSVMAWHPGGQAPIMGHAGRVHQATTDQFASIHDGFAYDKLKECLLGVVTDKAANFIKQNAKKEAKERAQSKAGSQAALQKHSWVPTKLVARTQLSDDTRSYIFQLPDHKAILGLNTCQHIQLGFHLKDKMVIRAYTPIRPILPAPPDAPVTVADAESQGHSGEDGKSKATRSDTADLRDGQGTFELVVKTYFPTDEQPGGIFSNLLDCMTLGEEVEIRGPTGEIEYCGGGKFKIDGEDKSFHRVSLVLGGSGVTPGYALMARIVRAQESGGPADPTQVRVVDANRSEADILLRTEMEELANSSDGRLSITHVLSKPPQEGWQGLRGHVDGSMLRERLFAPGEGSAVFVCGPPTMIQKAVMPALKEWGYVENENLFGF